MLKDELRKIALERRSLLSKADKAAKSLIIQSTLLSFIESDKAQIISSYAHLKDEVQTRFCNAELIKQGIILALPKIKGNTLVFYQIKSYKKDLEQGPYSILKPKKHNKMISKKDIQLTIIPCLALDLYGNRLGYGRGYFDRFLKGMDTVKVGLVFESQIVKKIQKEEHDIALDYIITEHDIIRTKQLE